MTDKHINKNVWTEMKQVNFVKNSLNSTSTIPDGINTY